MNWSRLILALSLVGCSYSPAEVPESARAARLRLYRAHHYACGGVRVAPTVLLTAAHCGSALSLDGAAITRLSLWGDDIAAFDAPAGPYVPLAHYMGEAELGVAAKFGLRTMAVRAAEPRLALAEPCRKGDSGSPVFSAAGVVAIVSTSSNLTCYAERIFH